MCNKSYITKIISERISDTVEFSLKKSNITKMSCMDEAIHASQDLINALRNNAPTSLIVTLRGAHTY